MAINIVIIDIFRSFLFYLQKFYVTKLKQAVFTFLKPLCGENKNTNSGEIIK